MYILSKISIKICKLKLELQCISKNVTEFCYYYRLFLVEIIFFYLFGILNGLPVFLSQILPFTFESAHAYQILKTQPRHEINYIFPINT